MPTKDSRRGHKGLAVLRQSPAFRLRSHWAAAQVSRIVRVTDGASATRIWEVGPWGEYGGVEAADQIFKFTFCSLVDMLASAMDQPPESGHCNRMAGFSLELCAGAGGQAIGHLHAVAFSP